MCYDCKQEKLLCVFKEILQIFLNCSTVNELKYLNVLLYTSIPLTSLIYSKFSFEISKYFDLLKLWCFKNYKLN